MTDFFSIQNIAFNLLGYGVSYLELLGVLTALLSVWYAIKIHIATWYIGFICQIAYFFFFFQCQLYSDMLLQVFFTVLGVYGILNWGKPDDITINMRFLTSYQRIFSILGLCLTTIIWGYMMSQLHIWLPQYFKSPAAAPYIDGSIAMISVLATVYQACKYVEAWWLWVLVNIIATSLYFYKAIPFTALLYAVFLVMAIQGERAWRQKVC